MSIDPHLPPISPSFLCFFFLQQTVTPPPTLNIIQPPTINLTTTTPSLSASMF